MFDLFCLIVIIAFFTVGVIFILGCEKLAKGEE